MDCADFVTVLFSFQGKTVECRVKFLSTAVDLIETAHAALCKEGFIEQHHELKLLFRGKRLNGNSAVFSTRPTKIPKIIVLATTSDAVNELNSRRSDPTIRGFDNERVNRKSDSQTSIANGYWGILTKQHKDYKFCRFQACTWQSFGHRSVDTTPHDFAARHLLEQLATDPGIVAILQERELVVTTLGEMDPIDDRLMHQTQEQKGGCLLGYNTNAGARIDLKLRTDDLKGFRPYAELAATLVHELSHNWVSEHNMLFWTNYGQMRIEYLSRHIFGTGGVIVRGQTTAQLAGLPSSLKTMSDIFAFVMQDLTREMAMHGLDARAVVPAIRERCDEWEQTFVSGRTLGTNESATASGDTTHPRDLALQAAERRRNEKPKDDDQKKVNP